MLFIFLGFELYIRHVVCCNLLFTFYIMEIFVDVHFHSYITCYWMIITHSTNNYLLGTCHLPGILLGNVDTSNE